MRTLCAIACVLVLFVCVGLIDSKNVDPWMNLKDTPAQRAQKLLAEMNTEEKLSMVHGSGGPYVGNVAANQRLKIPALTLEDGPQGVADGVRLVTCWPSALTVVASFDTAVMHDFAAAAGKEEKDKGTNIMLAPMVNIARVPQGGRNFESFGEDPYLAAEMVAASVIGIQSNGIMATVKHFVDNNQEYHRFTVSENVPTRAQHEIYYPAFKRAVEAGVASVMCSYNRINNTYACENHQTLTVDLKQGMNFQGFVQSDWGATHSTANAANAGLDMEMPDSRYFGAPLRSAVQAGQVTMERLNDMVVRILTSMFAVGLFDNPPSGNLNANVTSEEHNQLARRLAIAGTVLVKNNGGILPIKSTVKSIAVIGDDGSANPTYAGGGSGHVIAPYVITPLQGISSHSKGTFKTSYSKSSPVSNAVDAAKAAELAIVFVATSSSEGSDRSSLSLGSQDELVNAVAMAQPNTIVVVHSPGAVLMPWEKNVAAIVCAFMPGQEDGNAIADILFGTENPSGKLPITFPLLEKQVPANTPQQYPGINDQADYSEDLLVGYRWYDAHNENPLFPFGHGLSYTTFDYTSLKISALSVTFDISNTGKVAGAEAVQLYIAFPPDHGEPPQVLRGVKKVQLAAGASQTVTFELVEHDLSIWNVASNSWEAVKGTFQIFIGSSSRDIRLKGSLER